VAAAGTVSEAETAEAEAEAEAEVEAEEAEGRGCDQRDSDWLGREGESAGSVVGKRI